MTNEPWELSKSEKENYFGDLGRDLISPSLIIMDVVFVISV